jgi:hypothetical protein
MATSNASENRPCFADLKKSRIEMMTISALPEKGGDPSKTV